jgi:hypothetical protein
MKKKKALLYWFYCGCMGIIHCKALSHANIIIKKLKRK